MRAANIKTVACASLMLFAVSTLNAKKPDKPGGGSGGGGGDVGTKYEVIDLLGLPDGPGGGFQSDATALNEPSAGFFTIVGESYSNGQWRSVAWTVDTDGLYVLEDLGFSSLVTGDETVNNALGRMTRGRMRRR